MPAIADLNSESDSQVDVRQRSETKVMGALHGRLSVAGIVAACLGAQEVVATDLSANLPLLGRNFKANGARDVLDSEAGLHDSLMDGS